MLRVLLIDDESDALDLLEILLGQIGDVDVVDRYSDAVQALEAINSLHPDAVFMDIEMPKIKGTELARKIRAADKKIMIVFTTAYSEYAVEAFEIQSRDYLLKPFSLERLSKCVSLLRDSLKEGQSATAQVKEFSIQCMGGFDIYLPGNQPLAWKTKKEKEVCAFLIHHSKEPVDSDFIIASIWPEHDLTKAKSYLYTCLSYLRKDLSENHIPAQINKIGKGFLFEGLNLENDVEHLERQLKDVLTKDVADPDVYHHLKQQYRGAYMEGCDYSWAHVRKTGLEERYIQVLRKLCTSFQETLSLENEEDCLKSLVTLLPDSEQDGRALIHFYLKSGKRREAFQVYQRLSDYVQEHIGASLEPETVELYEQMAAGVRRGE
ncbi:response regulator [Sporolactobacillus kofuensis]|uniref:Response regulator n=1 Tax=Sporolactobacillus kofuensis TaxID=269672 RepID=A0ABW1WGN5_9BACL|nr:response regulator [Sporolactobacillus kofuensis]MCO7175461.1 response regulator [Sporolactobacillus kofuensis]